VEIETFATSLSGVPILSTTLGYFAATNHSKYAALLHGSVSSSHGAYGQPEMEQLSTISSQQYKSAKICLA